MGTEIEFSYPKPLLLLKKLILSVTTSHDTVLDFFSGSGTTACAVLEANDEDNGARRHIQVQLPEPVESGSGADGSDFRTIADISRSRIALFGDTLAGSAKRQAVDVGFRAYELTDTNFSKWRVTSEIQVTALEQHVLSLRDSADDNATPDALLTEILLKQGYSLTEQIGDIIFEDLSMKSVADGLVLACLDEHIKPTLLQLRAVLESADLAKFIILEDAFQGDDELKTNLVQEAKSRGVELWTA